MNKVLRITVSLALLALIARKTEWGKLAKTFAALRLDLWFWAVVLFILTQLISARRWQVLAGTLGFRQSFKRLTAFNFIGTYFNLLLPTSVGGDVVRAWYLDDKSGRRLAAFLSVFLDRLSGLLVLLAMACLAVVLSPVALEPWIPWSIWGMTAGILGGLFALPLLATWFRLGDRRVRQIGDALRLLRNPSLLLKTSLLSGVVQAVNVVIVWIIGLALHIDNVPASFYWILVPMVSLLTMLPVSLNGMGVREVSMVVLLAPLGVDKDLALSLALLWFAVFATVSLGGGVIYLFGRFPRFSAPAAIPGEGEDDHGPIDHHSDQGRTGQPRQAA